jgi:hypothetical protein
MTTTIKLPRSVILLAALTFLAASVAVMADRSRPLTAYQLQLRGQVDTTDGAPRTGRNPATQPQTSLAAAASQPAGNGLRVDTPAANITGDHNHHVQPSAVLPNPHTTGKLFNGCLIGYPAAGEQCVTEKK